MIDIITGTAFDAPKRMHHAEDEPALEFPSSATSRRRGLLALRGMMFGGSNSEEAMYKEMFAALVSGNGAGVDIVDDEATTINGPVLWGALGVHSIHMANAVSTATSGGDSSLLRVIDNAGTGSSKNLVSVYLPKYAGGLHSFCFHMGSKIQSITLGDFSVPGSYTSLYNCSALTSFTVSKTADAMLALITSNKVINIPSACVFHCLGGKKIVKSGSSWVIQDE